MQSKRRSVFSPRAVAREISEIESAHYTEMFREDLSMLLPSYHDAESVIRLEPEDANVEALIEEALQFHDVGGFSATVSEFVRMAARTVAGYGDAYYEITCESEADQQPAQFHFFAVDPESVVIRRGEVHQRIDPDVARERNVSTWIHIPKESVLKLSPPEAWSREFRRICYGLTDLSRVIIPDFAYPRVAGKPSVPIDTTQFWRTKSLAVLAVTKRTGWNARGGSSGEISGYYWFKRWLRFQKLKIQLRESLVDCLNAGLSRVGAKLGFSSRIVTSGLPTLADVASADDQLRDGSNVLGEIMKPFLRT